MRRQVLSILFLLAFVSIQYGKLANYLYCKYQAEIIQQLEDCGCESHLVGMFSQKLPDTQNNPGLKEVAFEFQQQISTPAFSGTINSNTGLFAEYDSPISCRAIAPALRPPTVPSI